MEPLPQHKVDRLLFFLKDDKHALLFCLDLLYVAHCWDDLIDKDRPVSAEEINQAFVKSLAGIPNNPFFKSCQEGLLAMMFNALSLWLEANEMRQGQPDERVTAFALENAVIEIIHFCILIKGQLEWAREVAPEFWELFGPTAAELDEVINE